MLGPLLRRGPSHTAQQVLPPSAQHIAAFPRARACIFARAHPRARTSSRARILARAHPCASPHARRHQALTMRRRPAQAARGPGHAARGGATLGARQGTGDVHARAHPRARTTSRARNLARAHPCASPHARRHQALTLRRRPAQAARGPGHAARGGATLGARQGTGDDLGERGSEEETRADDHEGQVDRAEDEDQKTKAK